MLKSILKISKSAKIETVALAAIALVYLVFIFCTISLNSVWFDESFTSLIMRQKSFSSIVYYTALDVHPPLYYLLLKLWTCLFGTSLIALRAFSAFCGFWCILLFNRLYKNLYTYVTRRHPAGRQMKFNYMRIIATALFALNPFFLRYCVEARMYIFDVFFAIASTYILHKLLSNHEVLIGKFPCVVSGLNKSECKTGPSSNKIVAKYFALWISFGLLNVCGMYTHYFYIFVIVAQLIWIVVFRKQYAINIYTVSTALFSFILYIPWIPVVLKQMSAVQIGTFWIPQSNSDTFISFFTEMFFFMPFDEETTFYVVTSVVILLLILIRACFTIRPRFLVFLFTLCLLPPLYLTITNAYVSRYAITSTLAVVLLASLRRPSPKQLKILLENKLLSKVTTVIPVFLLIIQIGVGIPDLITIGNYSPYTHSKEGYLNVFRQIQSNFKPGDTILVRDYYTYMELAAYETKEIPVHFVDNEFENYWSSFQMLSDERGDSKVFDFNEYVTTHNRVWVVTRDNNVTVTLYINGLASQIFSDLNVAKKV